MEPDELHEFKDFEVDEVFVALPPSNSPPSKLVDCALIPTQGDSEDISHPKEDRVVIGRCNKISTIIDNECVGFQILGDSHVMAYVFEVIKKFNILGHYKI